MCKRYILALLVASTVCIQCKKTSDNSPTTLTDTVIAGTVSLYDQYGMPVDAGGAVLVDAWLADSVGNPLGSVLSVVVDSAGNYRFSNLEVGLYSLRFTAQGYGQYVRNNIRFDGLGGVTVPMVKLSTYAAGSVIINEITLSQRSEDLGGGNSAIADIDRTVNFEGSIGTPFQLKVRYFFGLDSSVAQGNCVFSYVSGAVEGVSGSSDKQTIKFGLPNLKTYFEDSSLVYVSAAVETAPSQAYQIGGLMYYPNVQFPLSNVKTIYYVRNAIK